MAGRDVTDTVSSEAIAPVSIEDELRRSYLDYAMSVIVSRALPDVRDGLKPVQRRILYAMGEAGYTADRPYRKSARIVGDVMARYHPHGDSAIYDAMVRMAQTFTMRSPLVDGQGNFGSMDADPPAAMRYTEARLARIASSLLSDIDHDTVDFRDNYDGSETEPEVLPACFPNLIVNGSTGIAVGMATNIPPHNLGEVIDACCAFIDDPLITPGDLLRYVPCPDFPTGGMVMGQAGVRDAYLSGKGRIIVRARTHVEEVRKGREAIIVTEVPYQVNKARLIERISELVRDKRVEGIHELRDESDRHGVRVVIELKRDAMSDVVLNQLWHYTPLQIVFAVNMLALDEAGRPRQMSLLDVIARFIRFREDVVTRRLRHELARMQERAHQLIGLAIAVTEVDEVVTLIRNAASPEDARTQLMARTWRAAVVEPVLGLIEGTEALTRLREEGVYRLSLEQARAILELRLQRLTGLERDKIIAELKGLAEKIKGHLTILASRDRLMELIRGELVALRDEFASERRTELGEEVFDRTDEDLIQPEDMVVTVSLNGYVKRVPLADYRAQRRGGKGRSGMSIRDEDVVNQVFVVNTHAWVLFFATSGLVFRLKTYRLPMATPQARGKAFVNLLPLDDGETISTVMPMPIDEASWDDLHVVFATAQGTIRRNRLSDFANIRRNGLIAMKLEEGERLIGVKTCREDQDILLFTRQGRAIRFPVDAIRTFAGRTSTGVRGIRLGDGDAVIDMTVLDHIDINPEVRAAYLKRAGLERRADQEETDDVPGIADDVYEELRGREQFLLTVASDGLGKRSSAYEYRVAGRGGQGIANMDLDRGEDMDRAEVVASFPIVDSDQIVLVSDSGQLIRSPVNEIRIAGRNTRGVHLFRVTEGTKVVSVALVKEEDNGDP